MFREGLIKRLRLSENINYISFLKMFPNYEYILRYTRIFQIFTEEGDHPVGQIRKNWSGVLREVFTDSDNFGVTFPIDLDVGIKATVLAAVFMIVRYIICLSSHLVIVKYNEILALL